MFFKRKEKVLDIAVVKNHNVNDYLKSGRLKLIYLILPDFGGSEGIENQIVVTPQAEKEKDLVDEELYNFLENEKSVQNFDCKLDYKGDSIVPSKIIITAVVDGADYKRVIEVW